MSAMLFDVAFAITLPKRPIPPETDTFIIDSPLSTHRIKILAQYMKALRARALWVSPVGASTN